MAKCISAKVSPRQHSESRTSNASLENWKAAQADFHASFIAYDEAGSLQRIQVLKYLVLTTLLMQSDINPFDSPETKAYANDVRISAMTELVDAYQRDDIQKYERILKSNPDIVSDPFIANNLDTVTRSMRTKSVLKLVAPYTRFSLAFIAKSLRISVDEVQDIVGYLILDNKLNARINQIDGTVEKIRNPDEERLKAVDQWTAAMDSLWSTVLKSGEGFRSEEASQGLGSLPSLLDPGPGFRARPAGDSEKRSAGGRSANPRKLYTGA